MTQSVPIEHHESQYSLVAIGQGTTEFECDHLHIHRETVTGEAFERESLAEYTGYAYVCDNCDEMIETVAVEECQA
jgi:hypothetical protein